MWRRVSGVDGDMREVEGEIARLELLLYRLRLFRRLELWPRERVWWRACFAVGVVVEVACFVLAIAFGPDRLYGEWGFVVFLGIIFALPLWVLPLVAWREYRDAVRLMRGSDAIDR